MEQHFVFFYNFIFFSAYKSIQKQQMRRINGIGQTNIITKKPSRCFFYKLPLLFSLLTITALFSSAQDNGNWILHKEQDGIKIYTQFDEFHDNANGLHYEYVILKISNTTSRDKIINISTVLYYDGKKISDDDNTTFKIKVLSGNSVAGNVSDKSNESLKIFRRFLNYSNKPVLTGFDIIINTEDL